MTCDLRSEQKQINDFKIDPRFFTGCVDMTAMAGETNAVRLETAFRVAETELGVARLLDPEVRETNPNFIKIRLGCVIPFPGCHWPKDESTQPVLTFLEIFCPTT